jgi:CDP-diacylglycerol---glycerol-3-phosphate 3-phosphatidyltransferase
MLAVIQDAIRNGDWCKAPNLIGYGRFILGWIPGLLIIFRGDDTAAWWWAAAIFAVAIAGDLLDGWVARRWNLITKLGELLDPLLDKVAIVFTMIVLSLTLYTPWLWLVTTFIVVRETVVTWYRSKGMVAAAAWSGKVKLFAQAVMVTALLIPLGGWWFIPQVAFIAIAVFATGYSWWDYRRTFVVPATQH